MPVAVVEIEVSPQAYEQQTKDGKHSRIFTRCFPLCPLPEILSIFIVLVIATCKELGITVIAYGYAPLSGSLPVIASSSNTSNSPLGRGLLTGQIKSRLDFEEGDFRREYSRFQDEVGFSFNACRSLRLTHPTTTNEEYEP